MTTSRMGPMIVGLVTITLGALIILVYYYQKAGGRLPFASERYAFKITIPEPQQLLKHADVRAAGVNVGEVNQIENKVTPGATLAIVELAIDEEKIEPVYRNSKFLVRQKTLVGENYIEIRQGDPKSGAVPEGAQLGLASTEEIVPLDKLLAMLDDKTRARVSRNFQTLGEGFDGRSQEFGQVLRSLQPLFNDGGRTVSLLETQKEQVAEAVRATGIVTSAIADRGQDFQTLVRATKRTAESVERRDEELKQFFAELPSTLSQARSTVTNLSGFSNRATPVVADLKEGLVSLEAPVKDLGPTATQARTLFRELTPALKVLEPAVKELKPFSDAGVPAVPNVDALMRQMNPFFRYLKPYDRDIGAVLSNFSAGHQQKTYFGQMARCSCPVSQESITSFLPQEDAQQFINALTDLDAVKRFVDTGTDPFRPAGQLPDQSKDYDGRDISVPQDGP